MNDLIETAIDATSHLLRRPQVTVRELVFIELFEGKIPEGVVDLTLPPLSDDDLITQARRITAKLVRTSVLKIRRPYKRHDDGTLVLDAKGEPKRDYIATMRIVDWTPKSDGQSWTPPLDGYASSITGKTLGTGIATGTLARQANGEMVNKFMVEMLNELLADLLDDDFAWLIEYYASMSPTQPKTPAERQRASRLMQILQDNKGALEQFAYLAN